MEQMEKPQYINCTQAQMLIFIFMLPVLSLGLGKVSNFAS